MPVSEHDIFFVFRISLIQDQPSMIVTCIVKVAFTMAHCSILIHPPYLLLEIVIWRNVNSYYIHKRRDRGTVALGHCLTATAFLGKNGQFNIPRDSPFSSNSNFIDETNAAAATAANYAWKTTLIMTIRSNVDLIFLRCEQRNSISRFLGWLLLSANALMLRALMCCSTKYEYLKSGWWWQALPTRPPPSTA